jgi:hypothetical protein
MKSDIYKYIKPIEICEIVQHTTENQKYYLIFAKRGHRTLQHSGDELRSTSL